MYIPKRDANPHEGRVKDFLLSQGYCEEKLTPECVQDAIDDLNDEYMNECESPEDDNTCQSLFEMLSALERTKMFLEKYAKR